MYFAVLGKNPEISKAELQMIQPTAISYPKKGIIIFETEKPELLSQLGGIIKAGRVIQERDLPTELQDCKIIGIKEEANGKHLKKTIGIRRFKTVDIFHTDKEIKEKGKELINLGNGLYGIVEQYQNIGLYEVIDFDKPSRSMQMGMMPAKLTHIMINLGLQKIIENGKLEIENFTLYDPFVGSGTTGFLANALGFDFIGSDMNISYAEQNRERWKTIAFAKPELRFDLFQHDITQKLDASSVLLCKGAGCEADGGFKETLLIISEGWLGPIVTAKTRPAEIQNNQKEVFHLYQRFLNMIADIKTDNAVVTVITIPYYAENNTIEQQLSITGQKLGLTISSIPEVYKRENQNIGRKILIIV